MPMFLVRKRLFEELDNGKDIEGAVVALAEEFNVFVFSKRVVELKLGKEYFYRSMKKGITDGDKSDNRCRLGRRGEGKSG